MGGRLAAARVVMACSGDSRAFSGLNAPGGPWRDLLRFTAVAAPAERVRVTNSIEYIARSESATKCWANMLNICVDPYCTHDVCQLRFSDTVKVVGGARAISTHEPRRARERGK